MQIIESAPCAPPSVIRPETDLRRAQKWAVNTLQLPWADDPDRRIPGVILAWDMGAGKTIACLTAIAQLLEDRVIRKVLIVAPLLVAETTWPDEIEEWEHTRHLTHTVLRADDDSLTIRALLELNKLAAKAQGYTGKEADAEAERRTTKDKARLRAHLANTDTEIHIINKEGLEWLWKHFDDGETWPYDLIVIDEASMLKRGKKRVRKSKKEDNKGKAPLSRFGMLAMARGKVDAVWELTGTPTPKGLLDLWGLAYVVDHGDRLGQSRTKFERNYFRPPWRGSWALEPIESAEPAIMNALKDIMFSLGPEDYPDLPPLTPVNRVITLPPGILEKYKKFEREQVSEEWDVEAVNAGVLHNKLLQFANGSMYNSESDAVHIHDCKLDALSELVEELNGEPTFVAYTYEFDIGRIRKRFPKAVVLNEENPREVKRAWNAGKIDMLVAHPASAGHGLNFQYGGCQAVWYGLTSDLELYLQFNKRLHRPGQLKPVFLHHLIARGTLDEKIIPIYLNPRDRTQRRILETVKVTNFTQRRVDTSRRAA